MRALVAGCARSWARVARQRRRGPGVHHRISAPVAGRVHVR